MKVLHVTSGIATALGGPSTAAIQMCRALINRGVDVTLFTTDLAERGSYRPQYRALRLSRGERNSIERVGFGCRIFEARWPTRLAYAPQMTRVMQDQIPQFDVIHIHSVYVYTTLMAARWASRLAVPYLISPHGSFMPHLRHRSRRAKSFFHRFVAGAALDSAAAIHYMSDVERDQAADLGIKAPTAVAPLGVDLSEFRNMPPRGTFRHMFPRVGGGPLVVFIGRLAPRKGLDLLLGAFGKLSVAFPEAHLVLAGPDEFGYQSALTRSIESLGMSSRVTLPGLVAGAAKLALLSDADLWVLPSYGENFGIAAVEALAAGCAVVISDRVDVGRDVDPDACIVVPCDVSALTETLAALLASPSRRQDLAARARPAAAKFAWDKRIAAVIDLYINSQDRARRLAGLSK